MFITTVILSTFVHCVCVCVCDMQTDFGSVAIISLCGG